MPTEEAGRKNFAGIAAISRFAYRWNINNATRIFHMAADTEDDMKQWITAVEKASREHTAGTSRRGDDDDDAKSSTSPGSRELSAEFVESVTQEAPTGQVTFVFTDVQSSTTLWEKVPDAMNLSLEQHDRILRELLKRFRGYEVKTEGDAFMVTFFCVEDAILWCLAVQEALFAAVWSDEFLSMPAAAQERVVDPSTGEKTLLVFNGIRIRMGIHTGEPNCRRNPVTGRMDYFGPVVNRSARVSDTAHGGQVVCTQEVFDVLMSMLSFHCMLFLRCVNVMDK
jgi:class 3 adenylate cyclase